MKNKKIKRKLTKKGKLLVWAVGIVVALAVLALLSEVVLPSLEKDLKENISDTDQNVTDTNEETKLFYTNLTPEQLAGYEECDKNIFYSIHGVGGHLTAEDAYLQDGNRGAFWLNYITAIMNGDEKAYSALFSKKFDFSNPIERYADGKLDFPPQRLYNIKIELADEKKDPSTGVCESVFYVEYNIYRNEGDFRTDMSYDTAPLAVTIVESNETVLITDVRYKYN